MFEFLVNPKKAERKPWEMFFIGLLYSLLSIAIVDFIFIKSNIFKPYASILILLFTVMFCLPFMYFLITYEEKKDFSLKKERKILKEHGKALLALTFLFLGILVGYSLTSLFLPTYLVRDNFKGQLYTYCNINMPHSISSCINLTVEGNIEIPPSQFNFFQALNKVFSIFINNLWVMLFALLFSFIFGSGAIFILSWNASVIAIAIASLARAKNFALAFTRYMLHGLPEIIGYFIAGLAGGIISIAIIRHHYKSKEFWIVLQDALDLIIIAILTLLVAAFIEVFVSSLIF